jgi:integrase
VSKIIKSIGFSIKRPNKTRRTFAVHKNVIYLNGKRKQPLVEDSRIDAVNINLQRGLLTVDQAYAELKGSVIPALRRENNVQEKKLLEDQISETNKKVFLAFWDDKYHGSHLINETSTRNDLLAALRDIEPLSITTASKADLKDKLNALPAKKQRRDVIRINQLLEFLGRNFRIEKKPQSQREVDYVTWDELQEILPHIYSEEVRYLAIALWGTGARIGEAFAPGFMRLKPNMTIYINKQLDLDGNVRDIKNSKPHHTMLLPEAKEGYLKWCAVPDKERFRISAINQIIRASKLAFPKRRDKQISAHDLRHSYAIQLLGLGASLTQIALVLGDSISTVQLHYTGFVMTDEAVAKLTALLPGA